MRHAASVALAGVRVILLRGRLDSALVAGADPRSDPALALRAHQLIRPRYRRRLAASVQRLVDELDADRRSYLSSAVPVNYEHVAPARGTLQALAGALRDLDPIDPRGVALSLRLITDPDSPLYTGAAAELQVKAQAALDRLLTRSEPWCELPRISPPPTERHLHGHG